MRTTYAWTPLTLSLVAALAGCPEDTSPIDVLEPKIAVEPAIVDFGDVEIETEKELRVAIKNPGAGTLTYAVAQGEPYDDAFSYVVGATDVSPTGSVFLTVKFAPKEIGPKSAFVKIRPTLAALGEITIELRGRGATADLEITPQNLSFGNVVINTNKTIPVVVKNISSITADILFTVDANVRFCGAQGGAQGAFCVSPTTTPLNAEGRFALAPAQETTFNVTFAPTVAGTRERGSVSFQPCPTCAKVTVNMDGIGIEQGFRCDPASLDFGLVNPGSCTTKSVVCTNQANETITVVTTGALPGGTTSADFTFEALPAPVVLAEGDMIDTDVTYCPADLGNDAGFLAFETDNPDPRRRYVSVTLAGNGGGPDISVLPATLNFGQVSLIAPARRTIIITNVGFAPLEISRITFPAANSAFTAPGAGAVLAVGETLPLTIEFQPRAEGPVMETMVIDSNDTDEPSTTVTLLGEGINLPPCSYEIAPQALNFGVVERGRSSRRAFEVRNTGLNDCLVTGVRLISEVTAPEFSLPDGDVMSLRIAGGTSATFAVGFSPLAAASYSGRAEFSISSPTTPYNEVVLAGTGADAVLLITPNDLNFGTIGIGCNARARDITIYNTGSSPAQITSIGLASPGNPAFTVRNLPAPLPGSPLTLPPGASTSFSVGFRADAASQYAAAVEINGTFAGQPVSYVIPVAGGGAVDARQLDRFDQLGRPKADILFVIDNSCSMGEEQAGMSANLGAFLQFAQAQQIDYQIAVTTTDVEGGEDGRFVPVAGAPADRIVTPRTQPSPEAVFAANVNRGINGSADEQGLQAAYLALSNPLIFGHNAGFIRPDAVLSIIILSDEPDSSPGTVDFFINFFLSIKGFRNNNLFSLSAIVGDSPSGCTGPGGNAGDGGRYIASATRTGGVFQSICISDWSRALEDLSSSAFGFKSRFFLSNQPVLASVKVTVDGVEVPNASGAGTINWSYEYGTNSINFTPFATPEPGAEITVEYVVECL
jgi:hypothetical protein